MSNATSLQTPLNGLNPDLFGPDPIPLTSGKKLGDGIELRFADRAQLSCLATQETVLDVFGMVVPAIILRCDNRRQGEWMGIEIDVSGTR